MRPSEEHLTTHTKNQASTKDLQQGDLGERRRRPRSRVLIKRLARMDLLLIDEVGYLNLRPEQTNIFFKLMEERYRRKPTIITTNLEYEQWHQLLGNKDLTEALLSRLRHQCQTIRINGPSLRDPQGSSNPTTQQPSTTPISYLPKPHTCAILSLINPVLNADHLMGQSKRAQEGHFS